MAERKTAAKKKTVSSKTVRIVETSRSAWWCPICDRSATFKVYECAGCGATREGDAVTPAKAGA